MGWRYPGSTALTPPGGTGDGHFHPKLIANTNGVFESAFPIRRHIHEPLVDNLRCPKCCIKVLKPCNSHRCIHSRSSLMPSWVIFPFIQCHQTRGRALLGGSSKPLFSGSKAFWAHAVPPTQRRPTVAARINFHARIIVCVSPKSCATKCAEIMNAGIHWIAIGSQLTLFEKESQSRSPCLRFKLPKKQTRHPGIRYLVGPERKRRAKQSKKNAEIRFQWHLDLNHFTLQQGLRAAITLGTPELRADCTSVGLRKPAAASC